MAGTGVAAQHGILIKDAQALELAHQVDVVAFDKTGTLTLGQPRLTALLVHEPGTTADEILQVAASLQSGSEHPLARAVVAAAKDKNLVIEAPAQLRAVPGRGSEGQLGSKTYCIGSLRWMQELGVDIGPLAERAPELQAQGATVSAMAERTAQGLTLCALMAFGDEPKPGAKEALAVLRARGIKTVMVSGDNRGAAEAMARRLGLRPEEGEVMAEVLPGDKAALMAQLRAGTGIERRRNVRTRHDSTGSSGGPRSETLEAVPSLDKRRVHVVAMVGDGVNDAPALAAADVGMAMGNGTDVAMHAAGITLMRGDVALVAAALDISHRTVAKIRQNLFWAFAYNVAGIPLAALGYLNPVVAGAAMALSSVSVMGNALLLKRWHPQPPNQR
jgi:Cu+-exporting ATPase